MIDGLVWEQVDPDWEFSDKIPAHLPMDMIKRIDIIPPVNTTLFGLRVAGHGVINIITKTGNDLLLETDNGLNDRHTKTIKPLGYQRPAEFYSPKYDTPQKHTRPERDLRTTLYWNPSLRFVDGEASIEFYSSDYDADYSIQFDGTTDSINCSITTKTLKL